MNMSMKELVAEARAQVATVSPAKARAADGLILDVREPAELAKEGRVPDALHVPRGLLEAHADPGSPMASERLIAARGRAGPVVDVLCASGARATLAAATLGRMGYRARVIEGGLEAWAKAGLPVEHQEIVGGRAGTMGGTAVKTTRRALVLGGAGLLGLAAPAVVRAQGMGGGMMGGMDHGAMTGSGGGGAPMPGAPFRPLPVVDALGGTLRLSAGAGTTRFGDGAPTATMGYSADGAGLSYLGPTVRIRRGTTVEARVANETPVPISTHWHGLNVPSSSDGGAPQSVIAPGATWDATLPVRQPAATLWYHTHVHGRTAPDLWAGLAGAFIVEDDASDALGLPSEPGVDDLVLILQDKRFGPDGAAVYDPGMMEIMHGYVGDVVLANGQFAPAATVPAGPVRLRLINASTSAEHRIGFDRPTVLIAVDQGLLPAPVEVDRITIAPGERVEVVVDMRDGGAAAPTVSAAAVGGGMMGGGMMDEAGAAHALIALRTDPSLATRGSVPGVLVEDEGSLPSPSVTRRFDLQENMGPAQMARNMVGRGPVMAINGEPYEAGRIDFTARPGAVERWTVTTDSMAHPFHAHGLKFRILGPHRPEEAGWKDVAVVDGTRDLLVRIEARSEDDVPFMFHCHILEHEDAGMMGQFLVA